MCDQRKNYKSIAKFGFRSNVINRFILHDHHKTIVSPVVCDGGWKMIQFYTIKIIQENVLLVEILTMASFQTITYPKF